MKRDQLPVRALQQPYIKLVIILLAAALALLIWAPWSSGLYKAYSFSRTMTLTGTAAGQQEGLSEAAELYNNGHYSRARKILQKAYMFNPQNPQLTYYFAITLIETGQGYEARTLFKHLYEGTSAFKYDAVFYTALSFIKEDNKSGAISWLQKIPADDRNYAKAKELISKLHQ